MFILVVTSINGLSYVHEFVYCELMVWGGRMRFRNQFLLSTIWYEVSRLVSLDFL